MRIFPLGLSSLAAAACLCGCARGEYGWRDEVATRIQCRVFEVTAGDADAVLAARSRRPIAGSPYQVARVPAATLDKLGLLTREDSGALFQDFRVIAGWPQVADTWAYTRADGKLLGSGTGGGFVGVREKNGALELRLDYHVSHDVNVGTPDSSASLDTRIFYQGYVGREDVVVFLAPFKRRDGQELAHVIAFMVYDTNFAPAAAAPPLGGRRTAAAEGRGATALLE